MLSPSSLTLGALKNSSVINIAGVCANGSQFVQNVNEAVQRLMTYGSWHATLVKGRLCVYENCLAWPRWVGTVLATNINGQNRRIQNNWYEFMPVSSGECCYGDSYAVGNWRSNTTVIDEGITPVFQNVPCGTPCQIVTHTRLRADFGKTVTYYGTYQGQPVQTKNAIGQWQDGVTISLGSPDVVTIPLFDELTRVSKQETVGMIDVYAQPAFPAGLLEIAHYEPSETEPRYRFSKVHGMYSRGNSRPTQIEFLAKLQFVPVVLDSDMLQIDNLEAIKLMIQAERLSETGDTDEATKLQVLAIKELNRQLAEKLPLRQIPLIVDSFGTAKPSLAGIGQIM
jgi:hypothetical protein